MSRQYESRRVLVTGGAGFVGSHLARALVLGGANVAVADWQSPDIESPLRSFGSALAVEYLKVNVSDLSAVENAISGEFETIFHLAAQPIGFMSRAAPNKTMSCNVESTRVMLDFVRQGRARQLIFVSSACVFGLPDVKECPLKEESRTFPGIYPYTESKQRAESLVRQSGVRASIARFVNLFGEADWHLSRIVPRVIRQLLLQEPLSLSRSNGQTVLDFLHVSDAVAALLQLESYGAESPVSTKSTPTFNFGSGMPISVLDLIAEICVAFDGRSRPVAIPRSACEPEMHKYLDSARAEHQLGWRPRIARKAALIRTIGWYAQHGSKLHDIDQVCRPLEHARVVPEGRISCVV